MWIFCSIPSSPTPLRITLVLPGMQPLLCPAQDQNLFRCLLALGTDLYVDRHAGIAICLLNISTGQARSENKQKD